MLIIYLLTANYLKSEGNNKQLYFPHKCTKSHNYKGLVGRLMSPFSTKIGCTGDKVFGRDLVQPG